MGKLKTLTILAVCAMTLTASAQKKRNHYLDVGQNMEIFNRLYMMLDMLYVDTLDSNQAFGEAIDAMLNSLDPYTEYYPEDDNAELKMMLTGKYAGIGSLIRYHQKLKTAVIDVPYEGMPAAEAGLRKGDIIVSINDTVMTGKPTSEVSSRLKGEPGTTFKLKIMRPSTGKEMEMKITRRTIKLPDIPYYGMIGDVGYINFDSYTDGSAKEMRRAYLDLTHQGAKKLILDLRGNGGGSVQEAIDIINMWVPKDTKIVEVKGRNPNNRHEYRTRVEPIDTVMPIVVMVGRGTASASEITCGSMQDLDRGVVLGTRTYGKGLVQSNFDLPYNGTLKMTTAKYYIPSGRCIQAVNYKHDNGGYKERIPDSLTHVFYTRNGREVRDGGGIKPDVEVLADTLPNIAMYLERADSMEVMFDYVVDYISRHETIAPAEEFHITDQDYEEFKKRVLDSDFDYDYVSSKYLDKLVEAAKAEGYYDDVKADIDNLRNKLKHDIARDLDKYAAPIREMIESDIITSYYYTRGATQYMLQDDTQLKEALRIVNDEAEYKRILGRK